MPAADLSPERLAQEALELAARNGAEARCILGDALREGYPASMPWDRPRPRHRAWSISRGATRRHPR